MSPRKRAGRRLHVHRAKGILIMTVEEQRAHLAAMVVAKQAERLQILSRRAVRLRAHLEPGHRHAPTWSGRELAGGLGSLPQMWIHEGDFSDFFSGKGQKIGVKEGR
jgi:hypothetical protein